MLKLDQLTIASSVFVALGLLVALYVALADVASSMPTEAKAFMIFWLILSLLASVFISSRIRVLGFLLGLFTLLVGWRIAGLYRADVITYTLLLAFSVYVFEFFGIARHALAGDGRAPSGLHKMSLADWHLTFIRLYVGLDFVPHFTEKLFAGPGPHMDDVRAFEQLGTPAPDVLVWLAGLCELGAAIGLGLGLLTRLACIGSALYLFIATLMGKHFTLGFIWASSGGGWEYPVLWMVLILSFCYTGAGAFSIDGVLRRHFNLPGWVEVLMVRRADSTHAVAKRV
ncbi:MAG: DoxX family protein [Pseudomonadota bacterium]